MSVYQDQYVIINIWTNSKNKALPGECGVGHISITTPNVHISLWPFRNQSRGNGFFKGDRGLLSPFMSWPTSYKPDYEQDCILEGVPRAYKIGARTPLEEGERPYRYHTENGIWEPVDSVPRASEDEYYAIKPLEANFRMVLYSLDIQKIEDEFNELKDSIKGWKLIGTTALSRCTQEETTESCASLAYRCLVAGGFYENLKSTLSSQTSSAVDPEDLLRHVVAAKAKELKDHSETTDWIIEGVEETSLEEVKNAYRSKGLNASAADDFIPSIKPSGFRCIMQ